MQYNEKDFIQIQESLMKKMVCEDRFNIDNIKTIAGVDLAYWNDNDGQEYAVCCIVSVDKATHKIIETKSFSDRIECPYMPGFLAFRELPLVLKTAELLEHEPDIYMFDGNGYLHPRHMGIAAHASFYLNKPSIGVAKTYFRVEKGLDYIEPDTRAGSYTNIELNGEIYGRVLRTHNNVKPVFVSIGNYISLDTAVKITMGMVNSESRIPIPTRFADLETHKERARLNENKLL
ncbi:MAG: endonuclease V [Oscillospiraceae bacterium]|nr:endonuclease V [Oscillospiraceae bacterium]